MSEKIRKELMNERALFEEVPDCALFYPELSKFLSQNKLEVYYLNIAQHITDLKIFEAMDKAQVDYIPSIVKIEGNEIVKTMTADGYTSFNSQLEDFFQVNR